MRSSAPRPPTPPPKASAPAGHRSPRPSSTDIAQRGRRPRRRGLGQRLRAAHRQRRPGHPHQRWRAHHGLQHAGRRRPPRRRRAAVRHAPRTPPDEVAIDATSAEDNDIAIGSTIKVLFQGPTQEFTVVGTVGFGGEKNLGGTTSAYFDTATAQQVLGTPGFFDTHRGERRRRREPGRAGEAAQRRRARRRRGGDGRDRRAGELRRGARRTSRSSASCS